MDSGFRWKRGEIVLRQAYRQHGGGRDQFAREVLGYRDGRMLCSWYRGTRKIPAKVQDTMRAYLKAHRSLTQ